MNSIIGYVISGAGLIILLGASKIQEILSNIIEIKLPLIIIAGIGLIIAGIIFLINPQKQSKNKPTLSKEEVPIYQGEGKNRKIVAYRKD